MVNEKAKLLHAIQKNAGFSDIMCLNFPLISVKSSQVGPNVRMI